MHPILHMPADAPTLDMTRPGGLGEPPSWAIGKYDEDRVGVYTTELFEGRRTLHVGIDLFAPVGTPVFAFRDSTVVHCGYNPADGDYGHCLILQTRHNGRDLYALYGHLAASTLTLCPPGTPIPMGAVVGHLGDRHENGGWPAHLHFQLSWERPSTHDLPGTVPPSERAAALRRFPDPVQILGPGLF